MISLRADNTKNLPRIAARLWLLLLVSLMAGTAFTVNIAWATGQRPAANSGRHDQPMLTLAAADARDIEIKEI